MQLFQNITYKNKSFIVFRDDLSDPIFSGNKARKLAYFIKKSDQFDHIKKIVSFGGSQSNFLVALSDLSNIKGWDFDYWIKPLPKFLKNNPTGNIAKSISNGTKINETTEKLCLENIKSKYSNNYASDIYFFDQGGRDSNAEFGLKDLSNEILKYASVNNLKDFSIVVASGTGTTAAFLEKYIPNKIYTVACVGDDNYLKEQIKNIDNDLEYPNIIKKDFKYNFGDLDLDNLNIYKELLEQTKIEFDLLYDPVAIRALIDNYDYLPKPIIYIHCGGTSGNQTMLNRYKYKYNL